MAAIVWSDVTDFAAEMSAVPVNAQTLILAEVNNDGINVALFGGESSNRTKLARIYLAAHMGKFTLPGGAGGVLASQSEGGVSQSYAIPTLNSNYGLTIYGRMFSELARSEGAGIHWVP